ncbi:DHHA2 domain-containing protein [Citrus sinensis]|nr:DHHA2 domain-containing protein [Citrus sinensis]
MGMHGDGYLVDVNNSVGRFYELLQFIELYYFDGGPPRGLESQFWLCPCLGDKYVHGEDPYFDGLLRGDGTIKHQASNPIFRGSANSGKIYRSTSDIGKTRHKTLDLDVTEKPLDTTFEDSVSDINLEPFGPSSPGIFSKIAKRSSFSFPSDHLEDSSFDIGGDLSNSIKEPIPRNLKALEQYGTSDLMLPAFSKSYSTKRTKPNLSKIPLPQSAASFYNGFSPQMEIVESCESINRLNSYLKARKDEVSAGVPGRLLHVVIGQDVCDVGSLASTFMYAFYLNLVQENELFCTVPVINMKRADLNTRAELKWLLGSCQIDLSSLIFVDEIDLSYYDLFGSLKLVLINGHKLPTRQEGESVYPCVETVTVGEDCSCCTVVAENFALTSPQILAGQGFSRILVVLDATVFTKYVRSYLLTSVCDSEVRYLMYDVSDLKVVDILRKDFKKWKTAGKQDNVASRSVLVSHIGMSSIGISTQQLLAHEDASILEIKYFQQLEKVRLLMIVSGYYDSEKNFKREILVSAESVELMRNLLTFLNSNASQLPLKVLHQSGLKEEMKAFEIDKFTSRKTIERLLEEFGGTSKTGGISLLRD